jgi:hypothetical protein
VLHGSLRAMCWTTWITSLSTDSIKPELGDTMDRASFHVLHLRGEGPRVARSTITDAARPTSYAAAVSPLRDADSGADAGPHCPREARPLDETRRAEYNPAGIVL